MGNWKKRSSKYVYENQWIKVREDQVIRPDGKPGIYGVIEALKNVTVLPVSEDGRIWLVRHYRYVFDDTRWELVTGDIDADETPRQAALRELREELRMDAPALAPIGSFRPSAGTTNELGRAMLATGLRPLDKPPKKELDIVAQRAFSFAEIENLISAGEILNSHTLCALYLYKVFRKL